MHINIHIDVSHDYSYDWLRESDISKQQQIT